MADGPSHYREAERLAAKAAKDMQARLDKAGIANTIALAQVQATLAAVDQLDSLDSLLRDLHETLRGAE